MVGVGGSALEAVGDEFLQTGYVVAQRRLAAFDAHLFALGNQAVEIVRDFKRTSHFLEQLHAAGNDAGNVVGVEIDVGDGGEEAFHDEKVGVARGFSCGTEFKCLG
jgi:hypothetical protein